MVQLLEDRTHTIPSDSIVKREMRKARNKKKSHANALGSRHQIHMHVTKMGPVHIDIGTADLGNPRSRGNRSTGSR